ncbi:unnamed protein product [Bursaphelenchus okinawaensis]|uniref:Uncharacterized protein n=1 Tax=Bursaphelenchus okinawaensis TaxID=465554 RepID=A0A811K612_9BILA|nr:unnamed protein product [Bursaphelenchus okinawaensis]CAG9093526.1 unnamed protein product [Bursaphelenchus okinawaensis]
MEAHLFQEIHDTIEEHQNSLTLTVQHGSPIQKVVWSGFNYMVGPELKFVWKVESVEPYHFNIPDETSSDGNFPSISSDVKSTQGSGLLYDDCMTYMNESKDYSSYSDDFETENKFQKSSESQAGTSTLCSSSHPHSNSTLRLNNTDAAGDAPIEDEGEYRERDYESEDDNSSYTKLSDKEEDAEKQTDNKLTTSIVDSGITGTVSVHSELSTTCKSPRLNLEEKSDYGYCDEKRDEDKQLSDSEQDTVVNCLDSKTTASFLTVSNVLTDLSLVGDQIDKDIKEGELLQQESKTFKQVEGDDCNVTDEMFVAKYALAEQISSPCFESNPMVCKVAVIPNRQILIMSFLYNLPQHDKEMMALSLILPEEAKDWLGVRETVFEHIFQDILCRFKASYMVEDKADVICRITGDIYNMLSLFGNLERYPLLNNSYVNIRNTIFMKSDITLKEKDFLYRSLTGCLTCQGNCVVIGVDPEYVEQFMLMLAFFLPPEHRILCLKPHVSNYNPYLKIQAVKRDLIEDLYVSSVESHWSTCFIDIDRHLVTYSGNYFVHHERKQRLAMYQMGSIFMEAGQNLESDEEVFTKKQPLVEPLLVPPDAFLISHLEALWLLPPEQSVRSVALNQILLTLDYQGKAFIETVKDISEPSKTFKENAVSCRWSLSTVRKMMNLTSDSSFNICLSRADMLKPSLAQFIYQCTNHFR